MPRSPESEPTAFARAAAAAVRRLLADERRSQADLARRTTMSANYIAERLRDEKSFTLSDVEEIAAYFDLDPERFLLDASLAARDRDVSANGDTAGTDEFPVLTGRELAQRDLDRAAHRGKDVTDQEAPDGDDARPGA